ncbi:MAG TPA: hypothetical protein VFS77_21470 [Pyrinomonadaceae bacterium]|nr:hypothetical protein [Pyrinomonadaceae bacterium]
MKASIRFLLTLIIFAASVVSATAQYLTARPAPAGQEAEPANAIEEQAYLVLEDVVASTHALKLPQNRGRLQIIAADLLWKRDPSRARSLFLEAAANVVELEKQTNGSLDPVYDEHESSAQLRQELVLTAARHDPALAYELFQRTRQPKAGPPDDRVSESDTYLEQLLLTQTIARDPDLALRKAEAMLDRGRYSVNIVSVLEKLQEQSKPGAARLTEKILGRLQPDTLLSSYGATSLALGILRSEPQPSEPLPAAQSDLAGNKPGVSVAAYRQLLETVIVVALKATPNQQNARDLLLNLGALLPRIEQYLPARAQAVRQKINELYDHNKTRPGMDQLTYLTQQGTSDNLLTAAASAPSEMRDRLYQQAAFKALDEGSVERARQIANDHLDTNMRSAVLKRMAAEQQLRNGKSMELAELRQTLEVTLGQDRVSVLLQLAEATKTDNPKHSRQFLDEAFGLVTRPAASYKQFEDQLQVAHVLGAIEPQRGLDLLESGINKLNELLSAAASLNGFEVHIFKSAAEMPLPGNSKLGAVVIRYGQELAIVATRDFGRALAAADQFQYPESRLFARLSIVKAVLGRE